MARSGLGTSEGEWHVVGTRLRAIGAGNLDLILQDLSDIQTQTLVPLVLAAATRFEPTVLANFQSQRIRLGGSVNVIDEWFQINRILIFAKPVAVEYPQ